jgi:rare lipoprotein A
LNNVITDKTKKPVEFKKGDFYIQVGAFKEKQNAVSLKRTLPIKNKKILITSEEQNGVIYHKVKIIGIKTFTKALEYERYLLNRGYKGIFIVAK